MRIMEGVSMMKIFSVTIIHGDAIMCSVEGIKRQEMADFVVNILNCEHFQLDFIAKGDNNQDYMIETTFEATVLRIPQHMTRMIGLHTYFHFISYLKIFFSQSWHLYTSIIFYMKIL